MTSLFNLSSPETEEAYQQALEETFGTRDEHGKMVLRRTKTGKLPQNVGTPDYIFAAITREFPFDIDVAADDHNHKCAVYFTERDDGLRKGWDRFCDLLQPGSRKKRGFAWCNPPYNDIEPWVEKAYRESFRGVTTGMLLPARTDRPWFQDYAKLAEIRFIKGRIKFVPPPGWVGKWSSSAFPCLLMIFHAWPQNASDHTYAGKMSCVEFKEESLQ